MPFGNDSPLPLHDSMLKRWAQRGYEMDFLKSRALMSRQFDFHDFTNSVAADITNKWTILSSSTATTWAVLAEPQGWVRGVTGASVATGVAGLHNANKFWDGTSGAGFASRIRLSAVTNVRIEQGFVDVAPAAATFAVNVASASFNSVTTGAVYIQDNGVAASSTLSRLYTIGVSTAIQSVTTTTNQYASGVALFVAMEIDSTTVKLWLGDPAGGPTAVIHSAFAASEAWLPWFQVKTQSGSKNVDVDYLVTWSVGRT